MNPKEKNKATCDICGVELEKDDMISVKLPAERFVKPYCENCFEQLKQENIKNMADKKRNRSFFRTYALVPLSILILGGIIAKLMGIF